MFQFSRWLSLYWFVLLPVTALLATASHYREQRRVWQHKQHSPRAYRWMLLALAVNYLVMGLFIVSNFYETELWPPGGAFLVVIFIAVFQYRSSVVLQAAPFISPAHSLNSYSHHEYEVAAWQWRFALMSVARRLVLFLLPLTICVYVLAQQAARRSRLWLITLPIITPLLITTRPRGRIWWVPALPLILISVTFGWHAFQLRRALPSGHWVTPITSASCSSTVQLDLDRRNAWCADEHTGRVYQFKPTTGIVGLELIVESGAEAFAADANQAWVLQNPIQGLIQVENGQQTQIKINLARQGTVDREGRLWVIDVSEALWVLEPGKEWRRLKASDGLLDNTANVVKTAPDGSVWVGSVGGVSRLESGSSEWRHVIHSDWLPGAVQDFAFSSDGKVWYVWEITSTYFNRVRWGVSNWQESRWRHIELGAKTELDIPASPNAIAIDGLGRVWFMAPSYIKKANFLGILEPNSGLISLYLVGPFDKAPGGFPIPGFYGVVDDGRGGIFLYNPVFAPLRHWRPGEVPNEYHPCLQSCENAKEYISGLRDS